MEGTRLLSSLMIGKRILALPLSFIWLPSSWPTARVEGGVRAAVHYIVSAGSAGSGGSGRSGGSGAVSQSMVLPRKTILFSLFRYTCWGAPRFGSKMGWIIWGASRIGSTMGWIIWGATRIGSKMGWIIWGARRIGSKNMMPSWPSASYKFVFVVRDRPPLTHIV